MVPTNAQQKPLDQYDPCTVYERSIDVCKLNLMFVLIRPCWCRWVKDLIDPNARETALLELSKQREKFPELAPYLWNSFGTMAVLLQVCLSRWLLPGGHQPSPESACDAPPCVCRRSH